MKYQVLDRIFCQPSVVRKFEYLEINRNFCIIDTSEEVQRFAADPAEVMLEKDIRLSFPELIGLEEILINILEGEQDLFEIQGIARSVKHSCQLYINVYIIGKSKSNPNENTLIILIEEVTEKMLLEQSLTQRINEAHLLLVSLEFEKKYINQIINSIPDVLLVSTSTGYIKRLNKAAEELFGYTEAELINKSISLIFDDTQVLARVIQQCLLFNKERDKIEIVCQTKTREKFLMVFSCVLMPKKISAVEDIVFVGKYIKIAEEVSQ
ncbi:MAG: PAS domain S-box protein [Heteroscytonema crispum UTEX LB 1556]